MKKLLILGSNDNVALVQVVNCAKKMGIYTIVTDWNKPEDSVAKQISDEYWMISTSDLDALEEKCRKEKIDGIFGGTDYAVDVALELTTRLNLPYYCDKDTWKYSRDKSAFKAECRKYGVPTAKEYFISENPSEDEIEQIEFPVIVKPIDKSGNLGFSYCNNKNELIDGYKKAVDMSESGNVIIEQRLCGRDHTAFYALADGEIRLLNFFVSLSQPGTPDNAYTINTSVTDSLHQYLEEIDPQVRKLLKGLGYRDGVVWIEFMPDENGNLNALEIGHRLSGEMLWMPLAKIRGFDSLEWMINYAVYGKNNKEKLPENQIDYMEQCACSYLLWTKTKGIVQDIIGFDELHGIDNVKVSIVVNNGKYTDEFRYGAIISFTSENTDQIIKQIQYINRTVQINDVNGNNMLSRFDDFSSLKELEKKRD